MPEYQTLADNETVALQEAGTVAMTFQGSWTAPELKQNDYLKEHIAIAPLPKGPEGAVSMCMQWPCVVGVGSGKTYRRGVAAD